MMAMQGVEMVADGTAETAAVSNLLRLKYLKKYLKNRDLIFFVSKPYNTINFLEKTPKL